MPTRSATAHRRATTVAALLFVLSSVAVWASPASSLRSESARTVSIYVPRGVGADCGRVFPLERRVAPPRLLGGAMRALLAGPTRTERARGYGGWFSRKTADHLRSIRLTRGVAYVDFRSFARDIPNASSACGSTLLLAQLDRTSRQFPTVERTVYSFDGSRRSFYEWLQREPPEARLP